MVFRWFRTPPEGGGHGIDGAHPKWFCRSRGPLSRLYRIYDVMLRIRFDLWWKAGKNRRGNRDRCKHHDVGFGPTGAGMDDCKLQSGRNRHDDDGLRHDIGAEGQSILADVVRRILPCRADDTSRCGSDAGIRTKSLLPVSGFLGLSGDRLDGSGNLDAASSNEHEALRRLIGTTDPSSFEGSTLLLIRFGSLAAVMDADICLLKNIVSGEVAERISAARAVQLCGLSSRLEGRAVLSDPECLNEYLRARMAHLGKEQVRALYLDNGARLIADEVICHGTVDESAIFPREILRRALELDATALILSHNHPSSDARPSSADIRVTNHLQRAAASLNIRLVDHIIVGSENFSMRSAGMMQ